MGVSNVKHNMKYVAWIDMKTFVKLRQRTLTNDNVTKQNVKWFKKSTNCELFKRIFTKLFLLLISPTEFDIFDTNSVLSCKYYNKLPVIIGNRDG